MGDARHLELLIARVAIVLPRVDARPVDRSAVAVAAAVDGTKALNEHLAGVARAARRIDTRPQALIAAARRMPLVFCAGALL